MVPNYKLLVLFERERIFKSLKFTVYTLFYIVDNFLKK